MAAAALGAALFISGAQAQTEAPPQAQSEAQPQQPSATPVQAIDLSKPYGTEVGCQNQAGQKVDSEDMLLVTSAAIVTSTSTCVFVETLTAPDGTLVVTSLCSLQGEEGRSISQFSIGRSKADPARLAIFDEYGASFDEVGLCP